jgi:hypothetical protein
MSGREVDGSLRPYSKSAKDIDHWSLELVLNDLARIFAQYVSMREAGTWSLRRNGDSVAYVPRRRGR